MISWLRFLNYVESKWRRFWKVRKYSKKFGVRWEDYQRSGRKFSRVEHIEFERSGDPNEGTFREVPEQWRMRLEPGWEWTCQNCKTYSFIRESDMPDILKEWETMAANAVKRGYKVPAKPTAATAGCTNCRFRPGDPE